jgi:precorrin-6B methylase 2
MRDIHGKAILDYYKGDEDATLLLHTSYGEAEEMPVEVFFREEIDLSTLEHLALIECKGKTLDLGAGAGAHSLILQSRGFEVYALETSPGCLEVMQKSGVNHCIKQDFRTYKGQYDTVLVLMNGLGLAGKLENIPAFLDKCMSLLKPDGQLLIDSSDISYLYDDIPRPKGYFGEVSYQYEYQGEKSEWFDWVYVDQNTLEEIVSGMDLSLEILITEDTEQYLARIVRN